MPTLAEIVKQVEVDPLKTFTSGFEEAGLKLVTAETLQDTIRGKPSFLWVFSPGCGHCRAMIEEMKTLARTAKAEKKWNEERGLNFKTHYVICAMDGSLLENKSWLRQEGVEWFPYMVLYDYKGNRKVWTGERTAEAIWRVLKTL